MTDLWTAAPWAVRPELKPASPAQPQNMTTANPAPTKAPSPAAPARLPALMSNVPVNITNRVANQDMSGTATIKPAPATQTSINIPVPVPTKAQVAPAAAENTTNALVPATIHGPAATVNAPLLIDSPAMAHLKEEVLPVTENTQVAIVNILIHGQKERAVNATLLINTPVPEQMRPAALEHRATENTQVAIVQQIINGMALSVNSLTVIHATDFSNEEKAKPSMANIKAVPAATIVTYGILKKVAPIQSLASTAKIVWAQYNPCLFIRPPVKHKVLFAATKRTFPLPDAITSVYTHNNTRSIAAIIP